jgi:hypothetical protein
LITLHELEAVLPTITEVYLALGNHPEETSVWIKLIRNARSTNQKVYGILDNWVNYESRIGSFDVDEYIVFDRYAHEYVKSIKPNSQVSTLPNDYLARMKKEVKSLSNSGSKVLILGGRENDYSFSIFNRMHLDPNCMCQQIVKIKAAFPNHVLVLRLHPATRISTECSESDLVKKMLLEGSLEISDSLQSLGAALARASMVFGPHGYALFMSDQLGFITYKTTYTNEKWRGPQFSSFDFSKI